MGVINKIDDDALPTESGILVEFEGQMIYLTHEEIESHLIKYLKIRKNLKEEKRLRKQHESLKEAWSYYQAVLTLVK